MSSSDSTSRNPLGAGALSSSDTSLERILTWLAPGIFLVLPVAWVVAYLTPPINQDVAVILAIAERWFGGERMYVDMIDVNPPLIFMLNLIPVALGRVFNIDAEQALVLSVLALALWSTVVSWRMMPALIGQTERAQRLIFLPLIVFLLVVYPGEMFAQREHIMLIGAVPYVMLAALRHDGIDVPWSRLIAIAVVAALGFALKPHFLAIVLLVEGYLLVARGWRKTFADPLPWIMLGVMVAYVIAAWFVTPDYFTSVLPLVFSSYEEVGGMNPWQVLYGRGLAPFVLMMAPLTVAAFWLKLPPLLRLAGLAAIGGAASGVLQAKGWPYHLLPGQTFTLLIGVLALCYGFDRLMAKSYTHTFAGAARDDGRSALPLRLTVSVFMLLLFGLAGGSRATFYDQATFAESQAGQLLKQVKKYAAGQPVLIISPGIYPHFPVLNYADAKLAMRFQSIWPLQGAYESCRANEPRYHAPDKMPPMETLLRKAVVEDFVKYRPPLVVMDKNPGIRWCGGREFDLMEYFLAIPAFAEEWKNYDYVYQFDRYVLFKRRPPGVPAAPDAVVAGGN